MLTKAHFSFSIEQATVQFAREKNGYRMEVSAEFAVEANPLQRGSCLAGLKKGIMRERFIDLVQATYYLIRLFYQTGQKNSCTRTKLGKLLSIVAFLFARRDERIFKETICKYDGCGTTIKELNFIVDRDVYIRYKYEDDKRPIAESSIDENSEVPEKYKKADELPDDVISAIRDVFLSFGAYSAVDLGNCLNQIIFQDGVTDDNGQINLTAIHNLSYENFSSIISTGSHDLKLIDYLFKPIES